MTTDPETLKIIGSWMEHGRTRLPDHVLDAVLDQLPTTPQRRPWSSLRWIAPVAAVLLIALVGFAVLGRTSNSGVGGPAASPAPTPVPSQSVGVAGACDLMTPVEAGNAMHVSLGVTARSQINLNMEVDVAPYPGGTCVFLTGHTPLFALAYDKENGASTFATWKETTHGEAVPGLGDDALWNRTQTTLYIVKGNRLVTIEPLGGPDPRLTLDIAKAIGAIVVTRM